MTQSHLHNKLPTNRPRINWPSAGQILRQIIIVAVISVLWTAALVAYLQFTGGPDKAAFVPDVPTPVPGDTSTPALTPATTSASSELPAVTETSPAPTEIAVPSADELSPTQTTEPALTSEPDAPSTDAVSFVADVAPLFERYCTRCHGTSSPRAGLSLASYQGAMAGYKDGPVIAPGDAEASLLVKLVLSKKMPPRGEKPTDAEIQTIVDWINGGALEN